MASLKDPITANGERLPATASSGLQTPPTDNSNSSQTGIADRDGDAQSSEVPPKAKEEISNALEDADKSNASAAADDDNLELSVEKRDKEKASKDAVYNVSDDESSESETEDRYWTRVELMDLGKKLNTRDLHELFMERLARKTKTERKPSLEITRGIINYFRTIESRLEKVEESVKDAKTHTRGKEGEGSTEDPDEEAKEENEEAVAANEERKEVEEDAPSGPGRLPKFFHSEGELDEEGNYLAQHKTQDTYSYSDGPVDIIRVLYDWKEHISTVPPPILEEGEPDPGQIDIFSFMVASTPVARFFEKELGMTLDSSKVLRFGRPFRPLIRNLSAIREHLANLENKYRNHGTDKPASEESKTATQTDSKEAPAKDSARLSPAPTSEEAKDETESFDSIEALDHFRLLTQFVDKYLADKIELFDLLKDGKGQKIKYQDLWMLFDTGDTIYCPLQEGGVEVKYGTYDDIKIHTTKRRYVPQAYRVVATSGGLPLKKSFAPRKTRADDDFDFDEDDLFRMFIGRGRLRRGSRFGNLDQSKTATRQRRKEKYSELHVLCMYIDFNGLKFDTDTEIFVFKPFEGEADIKSLQAYPMKFAEVAQTRSVITELDPIEERSYPDGQYDPLVVRGRRFVDVTAVSHRLYDALTVGKSREEITSEVIVDFKLAFQDCRDEFPDSDSVVPSMTPLTKFWPDPHSGEMPELFYSKCGVKYCHDSHCINEVYFGHQQKQPSKVEPKIKSLLEEFETHMADAKNGLKRFKTWMEDNDLIRLLPGVVPGYALRNRSWFQLDLGQLRHVKDQDHWHKLVLPKGHREIVQAMVETYSKGTTTEPNRKQEKFEMDLVQGKGKGCIILLHGVPGVGKTSTAECVAAHTKKPLYPITCGDIGYLPETVEERMGKHFKLAHRWGCVLLLDEADVFLAKRNKSDVKRNGLVSVFLRILEYYSGILFLTTNRVGAIDDAFRSRLHLALYYPRLTKNQTIKIWLTNLDRLKAANEERASRGVPTVEFNRDGIIKWAKRYRKDINWNGRQIRNGFQTAVALAEFTARKDNEKNPQATPKPPVMETKHFKLIANAAMQFSEYLLKTHGENEEDIAVIDQIRTSTFKRKDKFKVHIENEDDEDSDDDEDEDDDSSSDSGSDSDSDVGSGKNSSAEDSDADSDDSDSKKKKKGKKSKDKEDKKSKSKKDKKKKGKKK